MIKTVYSIVRFAATNDTNGNPRRVYVAFGKFSQDDLSTHMLATWDEGYHGYHAVPEALRVMARYCPSISVPVGEYKDLVQWGRDNGTADDDLRVLELEAVAA